MAAAPKILGWRAVKATPQVEAHAERMRGFLEVCSVLFRVSSKVFSDGFSSFFSLSFS